MTVSPSVQGVKFRVKVVVKVKVMVVMNVRVKVKVRVVVYIMKWVLSYIVNCKSLKKITPHVYTRGVLE